MAPTFESNNRLPVLKSERTYDLRQVSKQRDEAMYQSVTTKLNTSELDDYGTSKIVGANKTRTDQLGHMNPST